MKPRPTSSNLVRTKFKPRPPRLKDEVEVDEVQARWSDELGIVSVAVRKANAQLAAVLIHLRSLEVAR